MPRVRPLEVKALIPLLEQNWETPEALAEALILALDEARASRTSYMGILRMNNILVGMGPYPGAASARKAVEKHPAFGDPVVTGFAIVPIESPQGYEKRIKELDLPPPKKAG